MAHPGAGLFADAGADHFVVVKDGAVEEDERRAAQTVFELRRHAGAAWDVKGAPSGRLSATPTVRPPS